MKAQRSAENKYENKPGISTLTSCPSQREMPFQRERQETASAYYLELDFIPLCLVTESLASPIGRTRLLRLRDQ